MSDIEKRFVVVSNANAAMLNAIEAEEIRLKGFLHSVQIERSRYPIDGFFYRACNQEEWQIRSTLYAVRRIKAAGIVAARTSLNETSVP